MTKAIYQVRGAREKGEWGLFPVDEDGIELMKGVKGGREVTAEVKQSRNPRHHRLYWALIRFIRIHSPVMSGFPESRIHVALKFRCGLVDEMIDLDSGRRVAIPRSIAWESMDQTEFTKFFDDAVQVIANRWMPAGTTSEAVRAEILDMVDPYKGAYGA
jgi:hypothetical protein